MTELSPIVDTITVRQDIGGPYPVYKRVTIELRKDGTLTWKDLNYE